MKALYQINSKLCLMYRKLLSRFFKFYNSASYWDSRYRQNGNSGKGSYGQHATFKAEVINEFVSANNISSVVEFGCGDGNQLRLAKYPKYLGLDISPNAIAICKKLFSNDSTKSFSVISDYREEPTDLALSLDVIYHLTEDFRFEEYMRLLFKSEAKFVIIYSSDTNQQGLFQAPHVKHRNFSKWVKENINNYILLKVIHNEIKSTKHSADFFIYEKSM